MRRILFIVLFGICLSGCWEEKKETPNVEETGSSNEKLEVSTLVTFLIGEAKINGKIVNLSDSNRGDQLFKIEKNALMDIQVFGFQSKILLRSKSSTEFNLYAREIAGKNQLNVFVKKGEVLFSIEKLKKGDEVYVYSPLSKTKVVGTQFKVIVKEDASTSIKVGEGSVQVNPSNPALEILSNSDSLSPEKKTKIDTILGDNATVDHGNEIQLSKSSIKTALADPELIQLLESPTLKKIDNIVDKPIDMDLKKELSILETKLDTVAKQSVPIKNIETKQTDSKEIVKEANQIVNLENVENKNKETLKSEVKNAIKSNTPELLNTMSQVLGKKSETIILKNGQQISGLVYQSGTKIIVKTPTDSKTFNDSEISGFRF